MIVFDPTKSIVNTNIFFACTQSTATLGAGLNVTNTTISLSNDLTSKKNLVLLNAQWSFLGQPPNDTVVALVGNYSATSNVTHTTPLLVQSAYINTVGGTGVGTRAVGKADSASTFPIQPVYYMILSGTAATALGPSSPFTDISGVFVIPPGGYVAIQGTGGSNGFCSMMWAEYPISI
jgi:hypothetical protein